LFCKKRAVAARERERESNLISDAQKGLSISFSIYIMYIAPTNYARARRHYVIFEWVIGGRIK
jgi:hypothetical protein